ncbi:MAG TPA: FGGY family carbohydrate kinase [Cyclobacteriaceae bacterium]
MSIPVIAVFDIGRTNKKIFLFNEEYHIVYEKETHLQETQDEDGFECEDVNVLTQWVKNSINEVISQNEFDIKAISISAHGASFVNIDDKGNPVSPLYNYLKPFPETLQKQFYADYGDDLPKITASPVLGNLNSGLQLYWIRHTKPEVFKNIKYSLHLPQYISYALTGVVSSDITSIGCHTHLWDFEKNEYHEWVTKEELINRLPPIRQAEETQTGTFNEKSIPTGMGLHDSSAALIPYLKSFKEPFILISTGTWCISLNPFNHFPLTDEELKKDCLCYLSYEGKPVKASRLFAGHEHEEQIKRIASHFHQKDDFYKNVDYNEALALNLKKQTNPLSEKEFQGGIHSSAFVQRIMSSFNSAEEAYHQLIIDIIDQQVISTKLVLKMITVNRIFVDGGFSKNPVYMNLLASDLPDLKVYGASVAQASALGAALVLHQHWNTKGIPTDLIELNTYGDAHLVNL